ncbi:MAG: argininosuccinate lyase [Bacteroidota bacterium]
MKLWQKNKAIDQAIETFTIGQDRELDLQIARFDVLGSLAHVQMLVHINLLTNAEGDLLQTELRQLYQQAVQGTLLIEEGVEDIHSQVEQLLTMRLGEVGKKIHSGRSRNDQVLLDLRLYFRSEIKELVELTQTLFDLLQKQSERYQAVLMPGYTHMQVAMVSSFGLWFGAYAESLAEDLQMLLAAYQLINQNPLGSAAGYGNSFPLNRKMTTDLLGFDDLCYNAIHAQMSRGKTESHLAYAVSSLAMTLNKLAMDICLFSNQNYAFIQLPDEMTTGSSIMPHKKNPDVFELIRGRCNQLMALPNSIAMLCSNLPSGYHREFQLLKEQLFPAIQQMKTCLQMTSHAMGHLQVNQQILDDPAYQYLYSVEVVNEKVLEGVAFRDAYQEVKKAIESGQFQYEGAIEHSHEGSIGNLSTQEIGQKMDRVVEAFGFEKVEAKLGILVTE